MFDVLFTREAAVMRHTAAPLLAERLRLLEHLRDVGAARKTLTNCAHYMLAIGEMLRWKLPASITVKQIGAAADRWIDRPGRCRGKTSRLATRVAFVSTARSWFSLLGLLQAELAEQPGVEQVNAYARFMLHEKHLSVLTVRARCGRAAEFQRLLAEQGRDVTQLEWNDVDQILALKGHRDGLTRRSMQTYAYNLRDYLKFLEERLQCRPGLAAAVRPIRVYQNETLPVGPTWDTVCQLLDTMYGEQGSAVRDRAIMMLFAIYGLRAAEVQRLSLDDLDWERGIITVHRSKQSPRVECYPFTGLAADAVAQYLRFVRPKSARREVFLHMRAPYQPLGTSALWQVVSRRLRPMDPSLLHHGPHALRHACATRLLALGLNMKEIGDFLGHRHPATTALYAKVNLSGLRQVADIDLRRFL
jgi:site-specific recombinase XerC